MYQTKQLNSYTVLNRKSDGKWNDLTVEELKVYFALYVNMSQVQKSDVKKYWSQRKIIGTQIFS